MPEEPDGAARAHAPAPTPVPSPAPTPVPSPAPPATDSGPATARAASTRSGELARLSREEAQRVIARALELQDAQTPGEGLSLADVEDVAAQIGVDPTLVSRALVDVRTAAAAEYEPSLTERLLGPHRVVGSAAVPGDPAQVQAGTQAWMTRDEGMRPIGSRAGTQRWTKDKRLIVGLQRGLQVSRASGVLRDIRAVTVAVDPQPDASLVVIDADTSTIRTTTAAITTLGIVGGVATGLAAAGMLPDSAAISSDLAQFALTSSGAAVVALGTAAAVARRWTSRVQEAVQDALDGIAMTTREPGALLPPTVEAGWRGSVARLLSGPDRRL